MHDEVFYEALSVYNGSNSQGFVVGRHGIRSVAVGNVIQASRQEIAFQLKKAGRFPKCSIIPV
jgi:hypothetical protein